jgi:hypothetical protein
MAGDTPLTKPDCLAEETSARAFSPGTGAVPASGGVAFGGAAVAAFCFCGCDARDFFLDELMVEPILNHIHLFNS